MPHTHDAIDFTVAIFVVYQEKVLMVHHKRLKKWLPLGGHIELDEDPEQAARREAYEECGFEVELLGDRPPTSGPGVRALIAPRFLDIHRISESHEHIGMIYWAKPVESEKTEARLAEEEHLDIRWCDRDELESLDPPISNSVKWYCHRAIDEVR